MKVNTLLVYLYFLYVNKETSIHFFNQIFHFHRFLSVKKGIRWEKMFWFEDGDYTKDVEWENIFRTLIHHEWLSPKGNILPEGIKHMEETLANHPSFADLMEEFLSQYNGETFKEQTCYVPGHSFPVSCHLCTERVCEEEKITVQDVFNLINFKGFKNPYKKLKYENPYFD